LKNYSKDEYISFWRQKLHLHVVLDFNTYTREALPPYLYSFGQITRDGEHKPILYINKENVLDQIFVPVNETIDQVTLELSYSAISLERFEWMKQLEATYKVHKSWGTTDREIEDVKVFLIRSRY